MTFDFSEDYEFLTDSTTPEPLPEPVDEGILGEPGFAPESDGLSVLDVQSMLVGEESEYVPPPVDSAAPAPTGPRMSYDPPRFDPVQKSDPMVPEKGIDSIIQQNGTVPFVQRIIDSKRYPSNFERTDGSRGEHRLSEGDFERPFKMMYTGSAKPMVIDGEEVFIAYPSLRYDPKTRSLYEDRDPYTAVNEGNYIRFESEEEAADFARGSWRNSTAYQSSLARDEPLPGFFDGLSETTFSSDDTPYFDEELQATVPFFEEKQESQRPTAIVNNQKYFLDVGHSPNPKLNLSRQILETASYANPAEEALSAEAMAVSIVEEAMMLDSDRPNSEKYARKLAKSRDAFRSGDMGFVDEIADYWTAFMFESGEQEKKLDLSHFKKGDPIVYYKPDLKVLQPSLEGFVAPSVEEYAEMLASESTRSLDPETRKLVYKYLDRYLDGHEQFKPQDLFLKSENVQSTTGKVFTQLLQLPTMLPALPVSFAVAMGQGRARGRGEVTNDVNYANQLNEEQGELFIGLRKLNTNLFPDDLQRRQYEVAEDAFEVLDQVANSPEALSGRPASQFGLVSQIGARSYQPVETPLGTEYVKMHPSDITHILQPEVLTPWQKGLWEHIQKVHPNIVRQKRVVQDLMSQSGTDSGVVGGASSDDVLDSGVVPGKKQVDFSTDYYSPEAIFHRNKLSAALSWVDATDSDNGDAAFLRGYKPIEAPEGGWASKAAEKQVAEQMREYFEKRKRGDDTAELPFDMLGVDTYTNKNERREYIYNLTRKLDQERVAKMAKEGAYGDSYKTDAGAFIAQIMTEITTQEKASVFNSVLEEYVQNMAESFSTEILVNDMVISLAGMTGLGDAETVREGEQFWRDYPVFALLNVGMASNFAGKGVVKPGVKGALKVSAGVDAFRSAEVMQTVSEAVRLLREGKKFEAKFLLGFATAKAKDVFMKADQANMKNYRDAIDMASSPIKRAADAVRTITTPDTTVRIASEDVGPTIAQKRREAEEFNAEADKLEASGDPMANSFRQKAEVAQAYGDALELARREEMDMAQGESAPGRREPPRSARAERTRLIQDEAELEIILDQDRTTPMGLRNLRKAVVPLLSAEFPTVRKLLAHLRSDSAAAEAYSRKLAASGVTDARVYATLLPDASMGTIADLVYRGENVPAFKSLGTVLDDIAAKTNTTPEKLMAEQNRLSTAEQIAQKGETRASIYESLGLLDDQVSYFVSMGTKAKTKPYVSTKVFGDGIDVTIKSAPHRGRFSPGAKGLGQVARRAVVGDRAAHLIETAGAGNRLANYGVAVAEFMERPFSIVNIPSWYSDFVNWGLHNQLSHSGLKGNFGQFLESTFMYLATPSSMLGRDVYQQIRRAGGIQELAKAEIEATMKDLTKNGDIDLKRADVANALNELGLFADEFGSPEQLLNGLTSLRQEEFQMLAEVIHRGYSDEVFTVGGVPVKVDSVMRLQTKRNGVWEDAIDHRQKLKEIKERRLEIDSVLSEQLTPDEVIDLSSNNPRDKKRVDRLKEKMEKQIPEDQIAALKEELDVLAKEELKITSITQTEALSGVTELRWAPALDQAGQPRKYSDMSPRERQMIAVANNTVAPISNKIFSVVQDIILGQQSFELSIQSSRPRGVITKEVQVTRDGKNVIEYQTIKDFGQSIAGQRKAASIIKAAKELNETGRFKEKLGKADARLAEAIAGDIANGSVFTTQTRAQAENVQRVAGKDPISFQGYEVIPKLANYVSSYFLREAEAGFAAKLINDFKLYEKDVKNGVESPRGISPEQFRQEAGVLAKKYLMLLPNQKKVQAFVDSVAGKDTYINNPVKALEIIMDTESPALKENGIILQGDSRYFKTRLWAKNLPFEKQLESLANYRFSATQTYLGLVQKREALRLHTMYRENGLLVSEYELNNTPGINKGAYVSGKSIRMPRLAKAATQFKFKTETMEAGGALSDFYIHKSVARHYANQKVLFDAQENFFVKLNNIYKIGAVVNPITGTIVRNLIGMFTFQSVAADIPFKAKYMQDFYKELNKVRRGEKSADPVVRQMVEEGVLGNLILELGDAGSSRAAVERFFVDVMTTKDGRGVPGEFVDAINMKDPNQRVASKLADSLMGQEGAWSGLADSVSLTRGSDGAYRPGQIPDNTAGIFGSAARKTKSGASYMLREGRAAYGKIDDIGRGAYAMELVRDHGYTVRDAVMTANKVMFDYPDVSMLTSMIRTNPFGMGMPFIGYTVWANTAFGNLLARQTPRAYLMAGMAKAHIAGVEAMLGSPGVTQAYADTEYDPGGLPLPSIQTDRATGYNKTRLGGREYMVGVEMMPGQQFSAFLDTDIVRRWKMAEARQGQMTAYDKFSALTAGFVGKQGLTGGAIASLMSPSVSRQASNNDVQNLAMAAVDHALSNVKGDNIEDLESVTPRPSDSADARLLKESIRNFPFFGAAIRGVIGIWSAATGQSIAGIDSTGREAITKALGYSSKIYDPEFQQVLTRQGLEELRYLKALQEAFFQKGREVEITKEQGGKISPELERAVIAYQNKIGEQIEKMQYENGLVKAGFDFEVAKQLEKVRVAQRALVRGGDMSRQDYELMTEDPYFSLPSPKPEFDAPVSEQPLEQESVPVERSFDFSEDYEFLTDTLN